jgi:hypothetical protein
MKEINILFIFNLMYEKFKVKKSKFKLIDNLFMMLF